MHKPEIIVSGGQSGVDRGALDAALANGFPCGGWCPQGRQAEDGPIDTKYPLQELPGATYRDRTLQNVIDSDGTVIIYFGTISGGTLLTQQFCLEHKKAHLLIDAAQIMPAKAAGMIKKFCIKNSISILNAAGPRASQASTAYSYTKQVFTIFLSRK
jgi:hypothetical protein